LIFYFFLKKNLCRVPTLQALGKEFLFFFTKILCRVPTLQALGKDFFYFFKKFLCRVPSGRHSAKLEFFLNFFAECSLSGTRQSLNFFLKKISMASAMVTTLGKDFFIFIFKLFAECPLSGSRQSLNFFFKFLCRVPWSQHSAKLKKWFSGRLFF